MNITYAQIWDRFLLLFHVLKKHTLGGTFPFASIIILCMSFRLRWLQGFSLALRSIRGMFLLSKGSMYHSLFSWSYPMMVTLNIKHFKRSLMFLCRGDPFDLFHSHTITPLLILYIFNLGLSTFIGRRFFKRGGGIALVYGTVMKNLAIALAYIIQIQSFTWYVKLANTLFGPQPAEYSSKRLKRGRAPVSCVRVVCLFSCVLRTVVFPACCQPQIFSSWTSWRDSIIRGYR